MLLQWFENTYRTYFGPYRFIKWWNGYQLLE